MWLFVVFCMMIAVVNIIFLQVLELLYFSLDELVVLILAVQALFLMLFFLYKRGQRKYRIMNLLLKHSHHMDVAIYDRKGKLLGVRGSFFSTINPLIEIEKRVVRDDYNDPLALSKLRTATLSKSAITVELALNSDDRGVIFTKVSYKILRESMEYMLWQMQDITAERTINEVVRKELKYLSEFVDNLPIGLYIADSGGVVKFANNRMCEWLGVTYRDIEGKKISSFTENSVAPDFSGIWQGSLAFKGKFNTFDAFVSHISYDSAGETMFRSVVIRDVEPGGKFDKELQEAELRFLWLFDEAPVGIAFLDLDYSISDGNEALFHLFGSTREKMIGALLSGSIHPQDMKVLDSCRSKIVTGAAKEAECELRIIGADEQVLAIASVFITAMISLDYSIGDSANGLVLHFIDITQRRELEEQFMQAQKMQALGLLAGGVAHDFNNTLTAIIGFCDLLLQRHGIDDPSFSDIMQIKQNANRSADLVRQLLASSRNQPMQKTLLNITEVLSDLQDFLRRVIRENIEVRIEHSRNIGFVHFDWGQMQQIIVNLAKNSQDAMPNGGMITIRTRPEKIAKPMIIENETVPLGKYVVIEVEDNGSGISEDILPRIFDPFFSTKRDSRISGSGLGLSITLGNIRQASGFIRVESRIGEGTKFIIYLPEADRPTVEELKKEDVIDLSKVSPPINSPISVKSRIEMTTGQMSFGFSGSFKPGFSSGLDYTSSADTSGTAKILFVEDEDAVRAFGVRALRNKGYEVVECSNAEEAVEKIDAGEKFDLLASDVIMLGMTGIELAGYVKEKSPKTKILLMSGYYDDIGKAEDSMDNAFLAKPFSLDQLTAKVKELLS